MTYTVFTKLKQFAMKRFILKDVLFYYTFAAIFLKCIIFLGLQMDKTHTKIVFNEAVEMVFLGPGYRMVFYFASVMLFLSFALLFKSRLRLWYMLILNLVVSMLFLGDLWYLRGFNTMPSLHILGESSNLTNLSGSILGMSRVVDVVLFFDALLLILFALFRRNIYKNSQRNIFLFFVFFIGTILASAVYVPLKHEFYKGHRAELVFFRYDSNITTRNLSPIGYHIYSLYSYWQDMLPYTLTTKEKDKIRQWFEEKNETLPDNKYKGLFRGKNLLMIQMESFENFVINQRTNHREITPNMNRLLKNSLYFSNIHEQVCEGNTADAELIANTSVYPLRQGGTFYRYPYAAYHSLPEMLENIGYSTLAVHSDNGSFWNWKIALTSMGFDRCIDESFYEMDETFNMGLSDNSYFRQIAPVIKKQKTPFYTFMVTLSNHTPFYVPGRFRELNLDDSLYNTKIGDYFQSVNYADRCIGTFLESLKKDGVLKDTVVVLYGDHEGVHKYFQDTVNQMTIKGNRYLDNQKEVPLIIYHETIKGEEFKTEGGQIDILPTIAYLLGIDDKVYNVTAMGRNLLNTDKNFAVLSDGTFIGEGDERVKKRAQEGLNIADMVIKGDYLKK